MRLSDINRNPDARALRQFALLWLVFFVGLAVWHGWRHERPVLAAALAVAGLAIAALALARPQAVRPIYVGSAMLAFPVGWCVSRFVLAIAFLGMFTPLALLFRLIGRDPLKLRAQDTTTCWQPRARPTDVRRYFRQY